MGQSKTLLDEVVLGEINGKNQAIHAYEGTIWKIRTGLVSLIFAGWAILLKGIIEDDPNSFGADQRLLWALLVFSGGLASGAFLIDLHYTWCKFRVIRALDDLMGAVRECEPGCLVVRAELLKVSGEKPQGRCAEGFHSAWVWALAVYLVPLATLLAVVYLLS